MHAATTFHQVRELLSGGLNQATVARALGVPSSTVNRWAHRPSPPSLGLPECAVCGSDEQALDGEMYAHLLGMYLGDGHIARVGRSWRLTIYLDRAYPEIIENCQRTMSAVLPTKVHRVRRPGCVAVASYSRHWLCLFPQHGPGKKHLRSIALVGWQKALVREAPHALVRGLIETDGCRAMNRVKGHEYPRYELKNYSIEIHEIFRSALDRLSVRWTARDSVTAVAKRADVAFMDTFVGPKA